MKLTIKGKRKASGSQADRAYDQIKHLILENRWPAGFSAFEPEVAETLEMSRTPVREALVRLEKEGLIRLIPRRGVYVVPLSAADMRDIYQLLAGFESTAAELLANSSESAVTLQHMRSTVDAMEKALFKGDLETWARADARFHKLLVVNSGNSRLSEMASVISDQAHRARMLTLRLRQKPTNSNKDHRALIGAIAKKDGRKAAAIAKRHRMNGLKIVLNALSEFRLPRV